METIDEKSHNSLSEPGSLAADIQRVIKEHERQMAEFEARVVAMKKEYEELHGNVTAEHD